MNWYGVIEALIKIIFGLLILLNQFHLLQERFGFILLLCVAVYLLVRGVYDLYTMVNAQQH